MTKKEKKYYSKTLERLACGSSRRTAAADTPARCVRGYRSKTDHEKSNEDHCRDGATPIEVDGHEAVLGGGSAHAD